MITDVDRADFVGGGLGNALASVNSAVQQVQQFFGLASFDQEGNINPNELSSDISKENIGILRKAAIGADQRSSMIIRLAYAIAKQNDPSARLTNQDFEMATRMVESSDKKAVKGKLEGLQKMMINEFNTRKRIASDITGQDLGPDLTFGKQQKSEPSRVIDFSDLPSQ